LAENRLFLSTDNYGLAWLWRPGVLIIFALTLAGILYPILKERWKKRDTLAPQATMGASRPPARKLGLKFSWGTCFSVVVVVLVALALWQSRNFGFRAGLFPWSIGFPVLAIALAQLGRDLLGAGGRRSAGSMLEAGPELPTEVVRRRTFVTSGWITGFFLAIWLLGFSVAVPVTMIAYLKAAREKWPITLLMALISWLFFYGLFVHMLHVPFPDPALLEWIK